MTTKREMTLKEWCERLPESHLVNRQLADLCAKFEAGPKLPSHIKEVPPERTWIEYECVCGSSAAFDYPLNYEETKWWFEKHANCPNFDVGRTLSSEGGE